MIDVHIITKVLDKIKNKRRIEKSNDTKILIDTDDRLPS